MSKNWVFFGYHVLLSDREKTHFLLKNTQNDRIVLVICHHPLSSLTSLLSPNPVSQPRLSTKTHSYPQKLQGELL